MGRKIADMLSSGCPAAFICNNSLHPCPRQGPCTPHPEVRDAQGSIFHKGWGIIHSTLEIILSNELQKIIGAIETD